jgi:CxxC motif-containing protein (DUF1111 family)
MRLRFHGVAAMLLLFGITGCRDEAVSPETHEGTVITSDPATLEEETRNAVLDYDNGGFGGLGQPMRGLHPLDVIRFDLGRLEFEEVETAEAGLGPIFNETSCLACHDQAAPGGAGAELVTRIGRIAADGTFDPLVQFGGPVIQVKGVASADCAQPAERVPAEASIVADRQTPPLFGLGLLDAVPDRVLRELADPNDRDGDGISGRCNTVFNAEIGRADVGRFGWKAQLPSLVMFAGDAYLNELGITNSLFPQELPPQGGEPVCDDGTAYLEDADVDSDGISDGVEGLADYIRFLAPPPHAGLANLSVLRGALFFAQSQCATCHRPNLTTGSVPGTPVMSFRRFYPFTDLLLHDMGSLGDGIVQGHATGSEMRTAPLWGLRLSAPYLHDGRAATIEDAIQAHDGEAARARDAFLQMPPSQRADLLAFLRFI